MTAILLVGSAARIAPLTDNRFHPDEALFAALARLIVSGRDPLLSSTSLLVDKPPLFYYTLAGSIALVGGSELAARLPGLFAGLISLTLTARLSWQLWKSGHAALLSLLVVTLSPFAILSAPTAFADIPFVMWLLAALLAVSARRWGWGGLLFGLALATKQNALFFAPLVISLGIVQCVDSGAHWRGVWGWAWRWMLGCGLVLILMALWDASRHGATSFWLAGAQINNPGRLARSREVWPRLLEWLGWLRYLTALDWLNVILLVLLLLLVPLEIVAARRTRAAASSLILLAFVIAYFAVQWLVAFPVLDRYMLPLVPLLALLIGRVAILFDQAIRSKFAFSRSIWLPHLLGLALAAALAWPAWQAARSLYPVGGDHGIYDGIDRVAVYLRRQPLGSVVYYHALGWLMDYYLFDAYLYPIWFETPAWLSDDLHVFGRSGPPRYVVLSRSESQAEIVNAVHRAGCDLLPVLEPLDRFGHPSMVVYRVQCAP